MPGQIVVPMPLSYSQYANPLMGTTRMKKKTGTPKDNNFKLLVDGTGATPGGDKQQQQVPNGTAPTPAATAMTAATAAAPSSVGVADTSDAAAAVAVAASETVSEPGSVATGHHDAHRSRTANSRLSDGEIDADQEPGSEHLAAAAASDKSKQVSPDLIV